MDKLILILLFVGYIFIAFLMNGKDPCTHLKGQDYHNMAYHHCEYNYLKGM